MISRTVLVGPHIKAMGCGMDAPPSLTVMRDSEGALLRIDLPITLLAAGGFPHGARVKVMLEVAPA